MFDFFTNRDRAINVDTRGNPLEVPTLTEKLEDVVEMVVPYDRTQPGFEMLQTASDLAVGANGAYMMGGPVRGRAPKTNRTGGIQEVETTAQKTLQSLAEERAFLEEVNQPAWRSGIGTRRVVKPINLPSWKTIKVDMNHIRSGHIKGGYRVQGTNKTLFPENMSPEQIEKAIRHAYRYGKKIRTQQNSVVVVGEYSGMKIEMYVDIKGKMIETAYPK